jgi:outer membrane protein assembly factor BamB
VVIALAALAWAPVSGQQPKRRIEPYVAPLLPGEQAWLVTLTAPPAAGGAIDDAHVYVPLQNVAATVEGETVVKPGTASLAALHRETGLVAWTKPLSSTVAPLVAPGVVFAATADAIHALDPATGDPQWVAATGKPAHGTMLLRNALLVALLSPDELIAIDTKTGSIAWRSTVADTGTVSMTADDRAVYLTSGSRIFAKLLTDGSDAWERTLAGTLGEPAAGKDRVLVGSTTDTLWALDPESGEDKWVWPRRIFGGDVIGAHIDGDVAYVTSADNIVRALNRGNGNQLWKAALPTRPVMAPRLFLGAVAVVGHAPTALATFVAKTGTAVSTWSAPADAVLLGPPLIDEHLKPYRVAMAVILRDGRVIGVRPAAMLFAEPKPAPLGALPGRALPREPPP